MAGDWIKVEVNTPDKAEVFAMAELLSIDSDSVVGKLIRVWRWFDQHTEDGNAVSVTKALVDRCAGVAGFADSMLSVGWLRQGQTGLELPNFDRHNGQTAKKRALTAKRVAAHKQRNGNDSLTLRALPREEKRRSKSPPRPPNGSNGHDLLGEIPGASTRKKPSCRAPEAFEITEPMWSWAQEQGVPDDRIQPETAKFLDHHKAKGSLFSDWPAAWRKWMRNVVEFQQRTH